MSEFQKHLYLILHPNEALVASQLSPEEFGAHYSTGSPRHFTGKVIFAEVDITYRNEYLRIDEYLAQTESIVPGKPKRTKFVRSYRVLEHVDLAALQRLYLVTTDGAVLGLEAGDEPADRGRSGRVRIYQEICPLRLVVASSMEPRAFGAYITSGTWSKGAPKIFFAEWDIDAQAIVDRHDVLSFSGQTPNVNPANLASALRELAAIPDKRTKTLSLNGNLDLTSFKNIQPGFWFADGTITRFYRMPTMEELHDKHRAWWRHL
jgi:hypothetical protein